MTVIGLIRHGLTDWNAEIRIQGHTDIPLNSQGRSQAERLAERMKHEEWDYIYSSDLGRARETAEQIGKLKQLEVSTDPRLREMYCGQIEGTTLAERVAKWGDNWSQLDLGMETNQAIAARGVDFVQEIREKHPNARVLIVSHGGLLARTIKNLIPHVDTSEHLNNTSVTKLVYDKDQWECQLFNCIAHLSAESEV
jgi:probable phosphoglycerate mutase